MSGYLSEEIKALKDFERPSRALTSMGMSRSTHFMSENLGVFAHFMSESNILMTNLKTHHR